MDIVERLRAREYFDTWDGEFVSKEAADEIDKLREDCERLREVLRMWVKFWENDESIDVNDDQWLAEEAMEATRSVL
ncbi:hypothetical protein UFOVP237_49 [uncultured Caudovirales phage]|uniref:Uncharacterized protein n=1 Tax=uncultured Caudovirales phage TaxID=2100421 RepID=A0A6J7WY71_9CAUD|nr:hypothetical protein UFOVP237_49 [uncultured Caudovirales phage]